MARGRHEIGDRSAALMVIGFRIKRFFRGIFLFALGIAVLAAAGGYIVALIGPEDGIARKYAEEYHLLPGLEAAKKTVADSVSAAHKAYEKGDIADLEQAEELLQKAKAAVPKDMHITGDQALVLAEHSDALRRWKSDLELEAMRAAAKKEATQLQELAKAKGAQADGMLHAAESALKDADPTAPSTLEVLRALASLRKLNGDTQGARGFVEKAKGQSPADPWTLAIEASLSNGSASADILKRVIAGAPDFAGARVKLARVLLDQGDKDGAKQALESALKHVPYHREAKRLLAEAALQ
jgi:hypothetical protein